MNKYYFVSVALLVILLMACHRYFSDNGTWVTREEISPVVITEQTPNDTDDPAIWYNRKNPTESLVLGTDKGDTSGGIYVFNLDGKIDLERSVTNLHRPNNIDIRYDFMHQGELMDIAVFTERGKNRIRVLSLPDCRFIDNGGIPVFEGELERSPMGLALYRNSADDIFAFVNRKSGPSEGYIFQYRLVSTSNGVVGEKVRALGTFSGKNEIEAMVVDDLSGYLYYSDEGYGIRKYHADPAQGNHEMACFGQTGFAGDHEGISIAGSKTGKGFIIVSDQQADSFRIFSLEGSRNNPHDHRLVRVVKAKTHESDGSEVLKKSLGKRFPHGIFVAMSDDRTFHFYRIEEVVGKAGCYR